MTLVAADRQRDASPVRLRRSAGASDRSDRSGGEHSRRGVVRHALRESHRAPEQDVPGRRQPLASGGRARAARRAWISSTTTTRSPIRASIRGSYAFSSLANFLAGAYNNAGFTQTFGETVVSQTNPNVGLYVQDEWKVGSADHAERGLRYDLQFLDTIQTDTNNVSPRVGRRVVAVRTRGAPIVRGSAGLFFDRVPLRALANALLSAGNTTDLANLRQISISLSPTQAGAPVVPEHPEPRPCRSVTLVNLTTMDRDMQNAYSRQASVEVEQQLGDAQRRSASAISTCAGLNLIMSINQNVPTCVASGTNNGCRPNPDLRQQQPVLVRRALQLPRPARLVRAAAGGVGQLPGQLHAVEVDEQRRRELFQFPDRSDRPVEGLGPVRRRPAASPRGRTARQFVHGAGADVVGEAQPRLPVEQHAPGVLGAAVQHHVRRHDDSGHGRPADRRRRVHRAECGRGRRLFQPEPAGQPGVRRRRSRDRSKRWSKRST